MSAIRWHARVAVAACQSETASPACKIVSGCIRKAGSATTLQPKVLRPWSGSMSVAHVAAADAAAASPGGHAPLPQTACADTCLSQQQEGATSPLGADAEASGGGAAAAPAAAAADAAYSSRVGST